MPGKRITMRKIREVLRLRWQCRLSFRQISRSCGIGLGTAMDYERRARAAGLSWEQASALGDDDLEGRLFPVRRGGAGSKAPLPDWSEVHAEKKRKGVTLALLWQEYKGQYPDGLQYSRYCDLYREWKGQLDVCMRQEHRAGERMFIDYCGQTVDVVDRRTGEVREAQVFVAVLGASSYTYSEATWSQGLEDWISSHCRAFEFFDGVSELLVPDNLKSGVDKACRYEPDLNPTYADLAGHYGTAVMPARVRKPRDKAKAESGVLQVTRWILAALRKRRFFSLGELNEAIWKLLDDLNSRPLKALKVSRKELFETLERPVLKPLPSQRFEYGVWTKARVAPDYHVEVDGRFYSVPYQLVKKQIDVRATAVTVECFFKSKRVAAHRRGLRKGCHTTIPEHMPKAHQAYLEWTPQRLVRWAESIGSCTAQVVAEIMTSRPHPQQGFRSCLGLLRLGKSFGNDRLEAACERALAIRSASYKSVKSILKNNLDQQPLLLTPAEPEVIDHDNIRGPRYFQ
jgi:transposase